MFISTYIHTCTHTNTYTYYIHIHTYIHIKLTSLPSCKFSVWIPNVIHTCTSAFTSINTYDLSMTIRKK